jgi:DNA-binding NtrC family response regulator
MSRGRILIVDDDQDMCDVLAIALSRRLVTSATSAAHARELVAETDFGVVLADVRMPGESGFTLCRHLAETRPSLPVILLTGDSTVQAATDAMRAGAYDFLTKPVDKRALLVAVSRALQHWWVRVNVERVRDPSDLDTPSSEGAAMRRVYQMVDRLGDSDTSVLVQGETGTGKELVARALHERSRRKRGPFVGINCAAMPAALLESELFGHARGAFTGAMSASRGLFLEANGGTLLLDEIGEIPLHLQAKLLRALQERTVRAVGTNHEVPFDARIVAATHRDLAQEVAKRRLREDLYYRINVVKISVPPLRRRKGDVVNLAHRFLTQFASRQGKRVVGLSSGAAEKLVAYAWPGNVRELENCLEYAVAVARFSRITVEDLPEKIRGYETTPLALEAGDATQIVTMAELGRRYIRRVLPLVGGDRARAASLLGIDRPTLDRYGVLGSGRAPVDGRTASFKRSIRS